MSLSLKEARSSGRTFLFSARHFVVGLGGAGVVGTKLCFTYVKTDGGSQGLSFP